MELKRVDDGEKGFEKVFAFLRDRLLAGSLKPGDRLVSERDLAIQLGVGRPLVREALRALTMLGIVEIRDRIGTVVTRPDVSVLNDFFTFALAQQADMPDDASRRERLQENENTLERLKRDVRMGSNGVVIAH